MVRRGELGAPIVIGRDHLDSGSVASPNRETEGMRDGSDAVSDKSRAHPFVVHCPAIKSSAHNTSTPS